MFRKALGLALIVPVMMQVMSFSVIYSAYLMNKSYISASLCENRTMPEKHCEGKCQLKKELKANAEKENSIPSSVKKSQEVVYSFTECFLFPCVPVTSAGSFVLVSQHYFYSHLSGIFHPPRT